MIWKDVPELLARALRDPLDGPVMPIDDTGRPAQEAVAHPPDNPLAFTLKRKTLALGEGLTL